MLNPIPWEVYDTRPNAIQALAKDPGVALGKPLRTLAPLVIQEVRGVTCVFYDEDIWTRQAVVLQPLLESLITDFGRDRILLDFSNQDRIGSPSMACIYALGMSLTEIGGRFGMCHLNQTLLDFLRWHDGERLTFPMQDKQEPT
jgi:hypothetical protein